MSTIARINQHPEYQEDLSKPLPAAIDIEKAVLGAVLLDNLLADESVALLTSADFFYSSNRVIFEAICELQGAGTAVDPLTLQNNLEANGKLLEVGGMAYIATLLDGAVRTSHLSHYAKILRRKRRQRQLIELGNKIVMVALDDSTDVEDDPRSLILDYQAQLSEIYEEPNDSDFSSTAEVTFTELNHIEDIAEGKANYGISTGYPSIDYHLGGLAPGDMVVVAGVSSSGKTAFALSLADRLRVNNRVGIISLEMMKEQLCTRLLSSIAHVDGKKLKSGGINREEWSRLANAAQSLTEHPIYIDDGAYSIHQLLHKVRRFHNKQPFDCLMIDYLQLVTNERKGATTEQMVTDISRKVKSLAKELKIPIIALAQLNNEPNTSTDHRPKSWQLRDSKAIWHDADIVLMVYREEYYNPTEENHGIAEIIIDKQRNGQRDISIKMAYIKEYTRFEELWKEPTWQQYNSK